MESKNKSKLVYFLVTEDAIYRTDELLEQIDHWIHAFKTGSLIRAPNAMAEAIDEFEAHLESIYLETKKLVQRDIDF
jgi:hypothetical protein